MNNIELKKKKTNDKCTTSIDNTLDKQKADAEISQNREIFSSIIKNIIFCGKQGITLRRHTDHGTLNTDQQLNRNNGSFQAL